MIIVLLSAIETSRMTQIKKVHMYLQKESFSNIVIWRLFILIPNKILIYSWWTKYTVIYPSCNHHASCTIREISTLSWMVCYMYLLQTAVDVIWANTVHFKKTLIHKAVLSTAEQGAAITGRCVTSQSE